ncbi:hypothetical protein Harman_41710 [Haloarcula mannanilytica]|uniref:Uncharacterized protein n=1 Tax=Haloarcula mannanilytica TaxID=2509225 RepID=A0A4C2EPE7_9EURY|nr:hypothetical protein [Haloarcula mannanilytica]GCF16236.1 hypothetical protein Harman_41710 [Haloarcula mannanilytica]
MDDHSTDRVKHSEDKLHEALYRTFWKTGGIGVQLVLIQSLFAGRASAAMVSGCSGSTAGFEGLIMLIERFQQLGFSIAVPGAVLGLIIAGLLWQGVLTGLQRKARRVFSGAIVGLIIVLISEDLVAFIAVPLCRGG